MMNIPELKKSINIAKKVLEDDTNGLSEQLENALQTLLSACQFLCDTSDKMLPKKECDTYEDDQDRSFSNGYYTAREQDILWVTKKLMGLEDFIGRLQPWTSKHIADAIIQLFGQEKEVRNEERRI